MSNKQPDIEEQIKEILIGKPGIWNIPKKLADLIAQREQQARLKALEWVYSYLPRGDEFKNAKKSDLQEIIMALDTDVAWEIAEIKELEQNKESRRQ